MQNFSIFFPFFLIFSILLIFLTGKLVTSENLSGADDFHVSNNTNSRIRSGVASLLPYLIIRIWTRQNDLPFNHFIEKSNLTT